MSRVCIISFMCDNVKNFEQKTNKIDSLVSRFGKHLKYGNVLN